MHASRDAVLLFRVACLEGLVEPLDEGLHDAPQVRTELRGVELEAVAGEARSDELACGRAVGHSAGDAVCVEPTVGLLVEPEAHDLSLVFHSNYSHR